MSLSNWRTVQTTWLKKALNCYSKKLNVMCLKFNMYVASYDAKWYIVKIAEHMHNAKVVYSNHNYTNNNSTVYLAINFIHKF